MKVQYSFISVTNSKSIIFAVPIIPDFLYKMDSPDNVSQIFNDSKTPRSLALVKLRFEALERENGPVGALLSSKALIQLVANPIVGYLTGVLGYHIPMVIGTTNLLLAALRKLNK